MCIDESIGTDESTLLLWEVMEHSMSSGTGGGGGGVDMLRPATDAPFLQSQAITALLRQQAATPSPASTEHDTSASEGSAAMTHSCDVVYALFLEPREDADPNWNTLEWLTEVAIKRFSPAPVLAHCELLVPPVPDSDGGRTHFATYMGMGGANWQNRTANKDDGISYYLIENGARWRALPVFGASAAARVRAAADANVHAPYSIGMYVTSAWPMRKLAWVWSDTAGHMGHCATLATRILKEARVGAAAEYMLQQHASAWYSPGSLYTALRHTLATSPLSERERSGLVSVQPEACARASDTLLRAPLSYEAVRGVGDAACIDAVRALTLRVCNATEAGDDTAGRIAENQLASALLRWALLREDTTAAAVEAPEAPDEGTQ